MKSVLPADLESKRVAIATRHNQFVVVMLLALCAVLFSLVAVVDRGSLLWTTLAMVGIGEVYGIRRLIKYDDRMCERLGFMCPYCHKPLYEPRGFINANGKCPKCSRSVIIKADPMTQPLSCWKAWLRLSRPRKVRIKQERKLATTKFLTVIVIFLGLSVLFAFLFLQLHVNPPNRVRLLVLLVTVPGFVGALGLLAPLAFSFKKSRRLLTFGEVSIGTITERARNTVTYEFKDSTGRVISASCPDPTGLYAQGMPIPVFFSPDDPQKDQVALCGSPYEVDASIPT